MGIVFALVIGLIVGAIAGALLQDTYDLLFMNIVFGIAGALLGLGLYAFTLEGSELMLFSWTAVTLEVVGATLVVTIFSLLHRAAPESGGLTDEEDVL